MLDRYANNILDIVYDVLKELNWELLDKPAPKGGGRTIYIKGFHGLDWVGICAIKNNLGEKFGISIGVSSYREDVISKLEKQCGFKRFPEWNTKSIHCYFKELLSYDKISCLNTEPKEETENLLKSILSPLIEELMAIIQESNITSKFHVWSGESSIKMSPELCKLRTIRINGDFQYKGKKLPKLRSKIHKLFIGILDKVSNKTKDTYITLNDIIRLCGWKIEDYNREPENYKNRISGAISKINEALESVGLSPIGRLSEKGYLCSITLNDIEVITTLSSGKGRHIKGQAENLLNPPSSENE